jgi:hypothetical protein
MVLPTVMPASLHVWHSMRQMAFSNTLQQQRTNLMVDPSPSPAVVRRSHQMMSDRPRHHSAPVLPRQVLDHASHLLRRMAPHLRSRLQYGPPASSDSIERCQRCCSEGVPWATSGKSNAICTPATGCSRQHAACCLGDLKTPPHCCWTIRGEGAAALPCCALICTEHHLSHTQHISAEHG